MTTVPGSSPSASSSSSSGAISAAKGCYTIDGILFKSNTENPADGLFDLSQITSTASSVGDYSISPRPVLGNTQNEDNSLSGEGTTSSLSHNNSSNTAGMGMEIIV